MSSRRRIRRPNRIRSSSRSAASISRRSSRPSGPRASRRGRRPVSALKERVKAELLPSRRRAVDEAQAMKSAESSPRPGSRWCRGDPRADPVRHASRRPRPQDAAGDHLRGRRPAPRTRLGRLPARRDAGPGHGHARHRQGRAARRRAVGRIHPEVHAALLLPLVFGGRGAAHPRSRPPRDRPRSPGRAERQAGAARRRGFSLYHPHHLRHPGVQRLQLDGHGLRLDAGPDGRGRADQQPGCGHFHRPGQGEPTAGRC